MPPRIEGTGRERHLQNPWIGVIPVAGRMHLGVTHGGRKGRGRGIDPFPDVSRRRHTALRRGNKQGRYLQKPWKGGIPVAWQMHLGVTHGGRKRRGRGIDPFPDLSRRRHTAPRRGNRHGKVFAKSMERRDPSGLANASWGHTRGPQGAGAGHWPFNLGFPPPQRRSANKVIGGRPPSHGAGGHLMHGARGAEKGVRGKDESRREQEGEPQLPFPLADAGVRRLCTQARPSPAPSGWTGPNPAG